MQQFPKSHLWYSNILLLRVEPLMATDRATTATATTTTTTARSTGPQSLSEDTSKTVEVADPKRKRWRQDALFCHTVARRRRRRNDVGH